MLLLYHITFVYTTSFIEVIVYKLFALQDSWALKDLVYSCYRYHGKECLLTGNMSESNESGSLKVVNNENGSVSVITDQAVVTLEKRQNSEV